MKSVTSGHCVVERMPLRRVSAVAFYKKKRYCPIFHCLRESVKDNQVAQRNHRYLGDRCRLSENSRL